MFVCGFCSKRYGRTKAELRSNEKMRGKGGGRKKADFFSRPPSLPPLPAFFRLTSVRARPYLTLITNHKRRSHQNPVCHAGYEHIYPFPLRHLATSGGGPVEKCYSKAPLMSTDEPGTEYFRLRKWSQLLSDDAWPYPLSQYRMNNFEFILQPARAIICPREKISDSFYIQLSAIGGKSDDFKRTTPTTAVAVKNKNILFQKGDFLVNRS